VPGKEDELSVTAHLERYRTSLRQIHLDFHTPDDVPGFLSEFSVDDFVKTLVNAHVQGIKVFAKGEYGNSYYFTNAGKRHPDLRRDWLKEVSAALRENGILCFTHYSVLMDLSAIREHPEWCVRTADGARMDRLCPNSPYLEAIALPQVEELTGYPITGFFFDIGYYPGDVMCCLCDHCRRVFHEEEGLEMSKDLFSERPELLSTFRARSTARMMKKLVTVRDEHAPGMIVLHNHAHVSSTTHWDHGDVAANTSPADVGVSESQPVGPMYYATCEHYCRLLRVKGVPFEILPVRFMLGWGEGTLKPLAQMNFENSLIAANGGVISHGDHYPPNGRLEEKVYERVGSSFAFIREREPFLFNTRAVRYAAVAVRADGPYWNRAPSGAERMLTDFHVQTDVLDGTTMGQLPDYEVLVVPDRSSNPRGDTERKDAYLYPHPKMTEEEAGAIAAWVKKGGRLIASGNAFVSEVSSGLAEKLLGVRIGEQVEEEGYLYGEDDSVPPEYRGFGLQVRSPFYHIEATTARPLLGWCKALGIGDNTKRYVKKVTGEKAETSAVFLNKYGQGSVLYFAFPIFLDYADTRYPWLHEVFHHLAADSLRDRPVVIDGYPSLRTNLREGEDGTLYLDLVFGHMEQPVINFPPAGISRYPVIRQEYPLANVEVFVRNVRPKEITLEPGARPVSWEEEPDGVRFVVPEIRTYDIVRIMRNGKQRMTNDEEREKKRRSSGSDR